MSVNNSNNLIKARLFLFLEISIILIIQVSIYMCLVYSFRIDTENISILKSIILYYLFPLISLIFGVILSLLLIKILFKDRQLISSYEDKTPLNDLLSCFKISKNNLKYQFIYMVLLLFLIYIPLDFIGYSIPGVLDFSVKALIENEEGISQSQIFFTETELKFFIFYSVIVYMIVAFREELLFRVVFISRSRHYIGNYSSVLLFSMVFGLSHLIYIVVSENFKQDILPTIIWGISAYIIGLIAGTFFIKKRYFYPLLEAHTFNNVISATALYLYHFKNITFNIISQYIYFPLLSISLLLLIIYRRSVKSALAHIKIIIKSYKKENKNNFKIMILFDIAFAIFIFILILFFF